ncbi:MAG: hypothetical protein QM751_06225 [Paludibacteraceae bacterium]
MMIKQIVISVLACFLVLLFAYYFLWDKVKAKIVISAMTELTKPAVLNKILMDAVSTPGSWLYTGK